jgi:hypothetical protein
MRKRRRRFKQAETLEQRLIHQAEKLRAEAEGAATGIERESLINRARQAEEALHMSRWLSSPGLQPPE